MKNEMETKQNHTRRFRLSVSCDGTDDDTGIDGLWLLLLTHGHDSATGTAGFFNVPLSPYPGGI